MVRTWLRSPSSLSFAPTAVAVSPPIPASTSSKMYVAPGLDAFLGEADGEHDTAELSARGVAPHRQLRLSGVRLDHELNPLLAVRPQSALDELRPEGRPAEIQIT